MARADKNTTTSETLTGGAPAPSAAAPLCPHCGKGSTPEPAPEDSDQAHRALIAKVGVGVDMNAKVLS